MAKVYCEFCGAEAGSKVCDPAALVNWTHRVARNVVRCDKHRRTSKPSPISRSHDPLTGEQRKTA